LEEALDLSFDRLLMMMTSCVLMLSLQLHRLSVYVSLPYSITPARPSAIITKRQNLVLPSLLQRILAFLTRKCNMCHMHPLCSSWMWRATDKHTDLKSVIECARVVGFFIFCIGILVCVGYVYILYLAVNSTVTGFVSIAAVVTINKDAVAQEMC